MHAHENVHFHRAMYCRAHILFHSVQFWQAFLGNLSSDLPHILWLWIDAVDPDTKTTTIPSCSPLALIASSVWCVISIISFSPIELTEMIFVITDIHYNKNS